MENTSHSLVWMIIDYHSNGSLLDCLTTHNLKLADVVQFARTTASGLAYLHSKLQTNQTQKPSKTKFRPSLKLDDTLSSIITLKLANPEPCHKYEPPNEVLKSAKKASMTYNRYSEDSS